jgi:hypothetical protein
MSRKKKPGSKAKNYTYTWAHVLMASPTEPMPESTRTHHLSKIWQGLAAIETAPTPSTEDWRMCSDALNNLETLVRGGVCEDSCGLISDAIDALAIAFKRSLQTGGPIRLTGQGIQTVRAVLEDYAAALEVIPHRKAVLAHMKTERRVREYLTGKRRPPDMELIAA